MKITGPQRLEHSLSGRHTGCHEAGSATLSLASYEDTS